MKDSKEELESTLEREGGEEVNLILEISRGVIGTEHNLSLSLGSVLLGLCIRLR